MTGFAGSRSLDERRRRRLASGADTVALETVAEPAPRRTTAAKAKRTGRGSAHFPLRKVISIRYWKLASVILLATLTAVGILAGGWAAGLYPEQLGPGFVIFFRLDSARLVRAFAALGLVLAGEMALLIGWARAQSLQDFSGRYRGWLLCAICAFLAAVGLETQLAAAWSATAVWFWPSAFPSAHLTQRATLAWIVPAVVCGAFVHAYLVREMRDCRLSLAFVWLAFLSGGAAAALVLGRPLPFPTQQARLVECGVALAFVICVVSSFLLHARHVIYVCVDPPAVRPSRFVARLRMLRPSTLLRFKRSKTKKSGKSAGGEVASLKRRTQKRRPAPTSKPVLPADVEEAAPATPSAPKARPTETPASVRAIVSKEAVRTAALPAEEARPADSFSGLSRRERRLLKKQMRSEPGALRRSA
jgi:hypothetical protein